MKDSLESLLLVFAVVFGLLYAGGYYQLINFDFITDGFIAVIISFVLWYALTRKRKKRA